MLCLADRDVRNVRVAERKPLLSQPVGVSRTAGTGRERFPYLPTATLLVATEQPLTGLLDEIAAAVADRVVAATAATRRR